MWAKTPELVDAADVGSGDVHVRNAKPLMIEQVERVGLELESDPFADSGVLEDSHVDGVDGLPAWRRCRW